MQHIVQAAESAAADIERSAQADATHLRAAADAEAHRAREEAIGRSQDHVGQVGAATSAMLKRVDAMEGELGALLESLRTGTHRLSADLSLLHGDLSELYDAGGLQQPDRRRPPTPDPPVQEPAVATEAPIAPVDEPVALAPAASAAVPDPPAAPPEPEPAPPEPEPEPAPPAGADRPARAKGAGDAEGARLIALNMALNGQSREETDGYLEEHFELDDRAALLDEVYATVEG